MNKKKLMALLLTGVMAASTVSVPVFAEEAEGGSSDTPLVIGQTNFSEKFSGLFREAVPDQQIAENVGEYLFGSDRTGAIIYNGIEGETHEYNGTDYTYTGLSDVTVTEGEDETVYNFKLREGVTFSDGEPLTADDLIFTYYVLSDTDYDGNATFYSTNIKGMKNYRLNVAQRIIQESAGDINVSEVAYAVGFNDPKYFTKCFKEFFGYLPSSKLGKR